jgi:hypothetical protein
MPRVFDPDKLKTDCANCDAMCCTQAAVAGTGYVKPSGATCRHLDPADTRCRVFGELEDRGFKWCRGFDCHGAGVAVTELFRRLGRDPKADPALKKIECHVFAIVYFKLIQYLHPDWPTEIDVPEQRLEELAPFTEAALDILADAADPFKRLDSPPENIT